MDISVADDVLQRVIEETKTKTEVIVFYYLILEVTRHQFCHMPLVTQTNSGTMWKGTTWKHVTRMQGVLGAFKLGLDVMGHM